MKYLQYLIPIFGLLVVVMPFILKGDNLIYTEVILGVLIVILSGKNLFPPKKASGPTSSY